MRNGPGYNTMERQYSVTNCRSRCWVVGAMFPPSIFEDRRADLRKSIDVDLRRSMCRLSKIDVSRFGDRCVDLRRLMMDVTTFEDRCETMLLHVHLLKTLILQEYIFF